MQSGTPLKLGIIGHPLGHTLSPALHMRLLDIAGITGEYRAYDIPPERLAAELDALAAHGLAGLNVTIPHKVAVMPLLDEINSEAQRIGAVNTIVFRDFGRYRAGHNTDVIGFTRSLPNAVTQRLPESHILVLGAGGAARAVAAGLIDLNTAQVSFAVRNPDKALHLVADVEEMKETAETDTQLSLLALDELPALSAFSGIIQTTPVGMWPHGDETLLPAIQLETLPAGGFVYDLIYRPQETRLLAEARALGLETLGGLDMLIHQGIAAFELWQEKPVPGDLVPALRDHLAGVLQTEVPA